LRLVTIGLYLWMSSAQFEGLVRNRLVAELEQATGGRVEIASFHWRLLHLEAEAGGLVIHGNEAPGEAPYARIDRLSAGVSLLGFWSPSVRLRDLDIDRPALHLIVYRDGSTNQPHPRTPAGLRHPQPRHLSSTFRPATSPSSRELSTTTTAPLNSTSRTAGSPRLSGQRRLPLAALHGRHLVNARTYRIEAGATDLNLTRGASAPPRQIGA
jgi:uncharacterized protein involved in outer membrane biogenesis